MHFHPHSIEIRYSLSLVACQLGLVQPKSLHIGTESVPIATAVIRQLGRNTCVVRVDNQQVQHAIQDTFGVVPLLDANDEMPADFGIYPFVSVKQVAYAREEVVAVVCENASSYKNLLYPGKVPEFVFRYLAVLRQNYFVTPVASLFTPKFIVIWTFAKILERLDSAFYFRLEDYAMRRLIGYGPMWRLSYLVILAGKKIH